MALDPVVRFSLNIASGLVLLLLAAGIARVRPRTTTARGLLWFAGGTGAAWALNYAGNLGNELSMLEFESWAYVAILTTFSALLCAAGGGLVVVALAFPRTLARDEARTRTLAGVIALATGAGLVATFVEAGRLVLPFSLEAPSSLLAVVTILVGDLAEFARVVSISAIVFALAIFALRCAAAPARERAQYALMSAALVIYPGVVAGTYLHPTSSDYANLPLLGALLLVALLWLRNSTRAEGTGARAATLVALFTLAVPLASLLAVRPLGGVDAAGGGVTPALARTLSALVLAYAILHHAVLGIDVKVRFAISKSTVAAVFIAVFFLASEGAQLLFGGQNELVGLVAAGALVFAMSPLQRVADRLAERAVPIAAVSGVAAPTASQPIVHAEREQSYRRAVRLALRDRELTREEERHLLDLAHHLGIAPTRAGQIHDEIAREGGMA